MAATPNLTRGTALIATALSTETVALGSCLVRFCALKRLSKRAGLDDYAICVAAVVGFIGTIFSVIEACSMVDSAHALEFDWLGQPWFMMGSTFAKISICLFFIRLVGAVKQWRYLLGSQIILMTVLNFAFSLTTNLQCRPLEKLWKPSVSGTCWSPNVQLNIGYSQGAFSVFWWLFLSLFPVMVVRDLNMRQSMRWPFYCLSCSCSIAAVFATVRTYETSQAVPGVYTFDSFFATILSILEQNVGIVAASILPVSPLLSKRLRDAARAESRMTAHGGQRGEDGRNPFESAARSIFSSRPGSPSAGENTDHALSEIGHCGEEGTRPSNKSSVKRSSIVSIEGTSKNGTDGDRSTDGGNARDTGAPRTIEMIASTNIASNRDNRNRMRSTDNVKPSELLWPRGIIKTVEVEVVEEDIGGVESQPQHLPSTSSIGMHSLGSTGNGHGELAADGHTPQHSRINSENDWATLLRSGPTPPGSRGPSRLGF